MNIYSIIFMRFGILYYRLILLGWKMIDFKGFSNILFIDC